MDEQSEKNPAPFLHVCLTVPDIDASIRFYTHGLGFVAAAGKFGRGGPELHPDGFEAMFLRNDGFFLELVSFDNGAVGPERIPMRHYGFQHFAFQVEDAAAALARARKYGGGPGRSEPVTLTYKSDSVAVPVTLAFCTDPSGNSIELVEHPNQSVAYRHATTLSASELGWASER